MTYLEEKIVPVDSALTRNHGNAIKEARGGNERKLRSAGVENKPPVDPHRGLIYVD